MFCSKPDNPTRLSGRSKGRDGVKPVVPSDNVTLFLPLLELGDPDIREPSPAYGAWLLRNAATSARGLDLRAASLSSFVIGCAADGKFVGADEALVGAPVIGSKRFKFAKYSY